MKKKNNSKKKISKKNKILYISLFISSVIVISISIFTSMHFIQQKNNDIVNIIKRDQKINELERYINGNIIGNNVYEIISSFNNLKLDDSDLTLTSQISEIFEFTQNNKIIEFNKIVNSWSIKKEPTVINKPLIVKITFNINKEYKINNNVVNIELTLKILK